MIRAARHYEAAAQIFIRQHVVSKYLALGMKIPAAHVISHRTPIISTCSVRIDIAGGWSDTPPLTYDYGLPTAVLNAAIRVFN